MTDRPPFGPIVVSCALHPQFTPSCRWCCSASYNLRREHGASAAEAIAGLPAYDPAPDRYHDDPTMVERLLPLTPPEQEAMDATVALAIRPSVLSPQHYTSHGSVASGSQFIMGGTELWPWDQGPPPARPRWRHHLADALHRVGEWFDHLGDRAERDHG
jgi:hypothetical protein